MQKYIDFLKERIGKEKLLKLAFISGIAGMIIILISDFVSVEKTTVEKNKCIDISSYRIELQDEMERMLEKIEGVGKVEVMITFSGTEEYVFAEEIKSLGGRIFQFPKGKPKRRKTCIPIKLYSVWTYMRYFWSWASF